MLQLCFARHNLTKIAQNRPHRSHNSARWPKEANKNLATHPVQAGETGAGSARRRELPSQSRISPEPRILRAGNGPPAASPRPSRGPATAGMPPSIGGHSSIPRQTRSSSALSRKETAEAPSCAPTASPETATEMRGRTRGIRRSSTAHIAAGPRSDPRKYPRADGTEMTALRSTPKTFDAARSCTRKMPKREP